MSQPKSQELLPCPLCGGKADLWRAHPENPRRNAWISCADRCLVLTQEFDSDEAAIAHWNRRAPSSPVALDAIVAAMKQSFRDVVAGSSNRLFEDTGVTMPADHVWERYAQAALNAVLALIAPAPVAAVPVGVKALEWASEPPYSVARPFSGLHYATETVWPEHGKSFDYVMLSGPTVGAKRFASLTDAKAAAQADYEARIRAALIAPAKPAVELVEALKAKIAQIEEERDEATNWSDIVDRHGTDQFDDLAEAWLALPAIQRVTNAVTSTFAKWANDELMTRFRQHQLSMFHMAYVEGCLAGVKAVEAKTALSASQGTATPDEAKP